MKKDLFKIYGVKTEVEIDGEIVKRFVGSIRLDLRITLKEVFPVVYFKSSPDGYSKNLGCHLFGQPDVWKGVVGVIPLSNKDVTVYYENYRSPLSKEEVQEVLSPVLDVLKKDGVIKDYKIIDS